LTLLPESHLSSTRPQTASLLENLFSAGRLSKPLLSAKVIVLVRNKLKRKEKRALKMKSILTFS
jgi:hypothetical protein